MHSQFSIHFLILISLTLIAVNGQMPESSPIQETDFVESVFTSHPVMIWGYYNLDLIRQAENKAFPGLIMNRLHPSARSIVLTMDCMWDAYVAIKQNQGAPFSGSETMNNAPSNDASANEAMAFAAHKALLFTFAHVDSSWKSVIDGYLTGRGYSLSNVNSTSLNQPSGVGTVACQKILDKAAVDGSNQFANDPNAGGTGVAGAYSDYTNYRAPQPGMPTIGHTDCSTLDVDAWQPARIRTSTGSLVRQFGEVTFSNMKPFIMSTPGEFRPGSISKNSTQSQTQWLANNADVLNRSANLGDFEKCLATYWQDSEGFGLGHWLRFAMTAATLKNYGTKNALTLMAAIAHSQMEGLICQNDGKRFWGTPRPTSTIQCIYKNQQVQAWRGPWKGVGTINGSDWSAFFNDFWVTNPTPEYPCGHCLVSAVGGRVMYRAFGNNDTFVGYTRSYAPGAIWLERKIIDPNDPAYVSGQTDVANSGPTTVGYTPANVVTLSWTTWSGVAQSAGTSRLWLGVHYQESFDKSYAAGVALGDKVWDTLNTKYFTA